MPRRNHPRPRRRPRGPEPTPALPPFDMHSARALEWAAGDLVRRGLASPAIFGKSRPA